MAVALIVISVSDCYVCSRLASQLSSAEINTSTVPSSASCSAVFPPSLFISLSCCVRVLCERVCVYTCVYMSSMVTGLCVDVCAQGKSLKKNERGGDECTKKRRRWCTVDVNTSNVQEDNHSVLLQSV